MKCEVLITTEFQTWYEVVLSADEQESVARVIVILADEGIALRFPYSSGIHGSRHGGMRELRIQHRGRPFRVLYAFDPSRNAILILGGEKTGDPQWYERAIPKADELFDAYLRERQEQDKN